MLGVLAVRLQVSVEPDDLLRGDTSEAIETINANAAEALSHLNLNAADTWCMRATLTKSSRNSLEYRCAICPFFPRDRVSGN